MTGYKNRFLKLIYTQPFNNPKTDIPEGQRKLRDIIVTWLDKNEENKDPFGQRSLVSLGISSMPTSN